MKNGLSLCIWGDGPGRPYDNIYLLKNISYADDVLHLYFQGGEECIINNPQDITFSKKGIKINNAERIIWSFYYYGKPKEQDTLTEIEYTNLNDSNIKILEKGVFNEKRIIPKNEIAFDSFGNLDLLLSDYKKD